MAETSQVLDKPTTSKVRSSAAKPAISLILALQNSESSVANILDGLVQNLENYDPNYEIICIDDGSEDGTSEAVARYIESNPKIRLIRMRTAFGEAPALDAGLKHARGEKIVYLTSRVNVNPAQVPNLLRKLEEGNDLVVGWRYPRRDSRLNWIVSRMFNGMINAIAGLKLHDINSGVFAARRQVLEDIPVYGDLNNFIPVLAVKQGYKVAEEKIEQLPGRFRTSRYVDEYIRRFLDIITVVFLTRYSKKPIHFLGFVGAVLTILGVGINLYLFVYRILQMGPIAGRPLLLLGALLLVIGIQMVSIGLIGEMIIFTHAKEVKEYNIEEIISQ
ncbi:MAG TPA: glycosyltransferase [Bacteroidetes bacterium]|nr:glycosyltransferase [Bacteroidota bacterium]